MRKISSILFAGFLGLGAFISSGCGKADEKTQAPPPMPVSTQTISLAPVPRLDEYVATVKSRRSASIQPQVDGSLTRILVKSGDQVRAGQVVDDDDPLKQQATVDQQRSTEAQKKATYDYNQLEVERQRKLYRGGCDQQAEPRSGECRRTRIPRPTGNPRRRRASPQQRELAYYNLTAPFAGIVGDIPVHIGDYVSPQTLLTTVDENAELEAYIYIPTETGGGYPYGSSGADCHQHGRVDREHENLFRFAASGQCDPGHTGEGADPRIARQVSQRATGEGAGDLEHGACADGSGAGGDAHRGPVVCLRGDARMDQWHALPSSARSLSAIRSGTTMPSQAA